MPIYEPTMYVDNLETTPGWVYFDETRDRESITLKLAGLTEKDGVYKSGVPLMKDSDGTYKLAAGTSDKPTVAAGLLLFDVVTQTGATTVPAVLFTRGTVNDTLPALPENVSLPATIRVQA